MKPKLTPWFPGRIAPAHPGLYEVKAKRHKDGSQLSEAGYAYWDGRWGTSWNDPAKAVESWDFHRGRNSEQRKSWRGLASKP